MATNEVSGFLKYKDEEGNLNLLLPITTKDNIDGLDEIEQDLLETVKFTPQALTDEQKAQAQANIGLNELGQELVAYASEMVVVVDPETMTTNYSSTEIKAAVDMGRTVVAEYDGMRYALFISTAVSQIFHVAFVANLDGYAARNTTLSVLDNTATIEIMDAASGIHVDPEEPEDAPDNTLWLDTDDDGDDSGPALPEYTAEDRGKVLTVTANGLAWVTPEVVPDGEEMTF